MSYQGRANHITKMGRLLPAATILLKRKAVKRCLSFLCVLCFVLRDMNGERYVLFINYLWGWRREEARGEIKEQRGELGGKS